VRAIGDYVDRHSGVDRICKERIAGNPALGKRIADRKVAIGKHHDEVWAKWQRTRARMDASPITFQRLAMEIWEVIKNEDWVLTAKRPQA